MQSSHLTRRVFRAILNDEPVCFSHHRSRVYSSTALYRHRRSSVKYGHSRTLFSFPLRSKAEAAEVPTSEVGLQAMTQLSKSILGGDRAPPFDALCKAYLGFFEARAEEPGIITPFHAKQLAHTYQYLKARVRQTEGQSADSSAEWVTIHSKESSELILYVLSRATCHPNSHHNVRTVAREAFTALSTATANDPNEMSYDAVLAWVRILAFCNDPVLANRVLSEWWPKLRLWPGLDAQSSPWLWVLHGTALKETSSGLRDLVQRLSVDHKFDLNPQQHEELITALLSQDEFDAAKIVYDCPLPLNAQPTIAATVFCARTAILRSSSTSNGDLAWAHRILRPYSPSPCAETRDILLLNEATRDRSPLSLSHKLDTWCAEDPSVRDGLSVSCVNDLIRYAKAIGNQELALQFSQLISRWNLESDLETLILLHLEPRIEASDVKGTIEILRELEKTEDASASIDLALRYKLIKMFCQFPNNDDAFDQVSALLDPLMSQNIQLEPETLAALTHLLAYRHDWQALSQLLRPRLGTYSLETERPIIRSALTKFILDREQDNDEVLAAYELMRLAFPDTDTDTRISIMNAFFDRSMLDDGCQVFGHMRHAASRLHRPTAEAYISCFLGLARAADWKNVKLIRNMLKLDVEIDVTTRVRNAVMLALACCQKPEQAMLEFRAILRSEEGPSQHTLAIFFKMCESHPDGVAEAKKMLRKITALEIPLDRALYLAYVKSLAAQGERELVVEALGETEQKLGQSPDGNMIARIYNACAHEYAKEGIEQWAKEVLPSVWQELEKMPRSEQEEGIHLEGFEEVFVV